MNITFNELRQLKHSLPTGSISKIASELNTDEQTIRNYFGARKFDQGDIVSFHKQPGPNGGIVKLEDDTIYLAAKRILEQTSN